MYFQKQRSAVATVDVPEEDVAQAGSSSSIGNGGGTAAAAAASSSTPATSSSSTSSSHAHVIKCVAGGMSIDIQANQVGELCVAALIEEADRLLGQSVS